MSKSKTQASESTAVVIPQSRYDEAALSALTTKSAKIRFLHAAGMTRSEIVKELNRLGVTVIYQHVRGVLVQPMPKGQQAPSAPATTEAVTETKTETA